MKFEQKYPDLKPGEIISNNQDFTLRSVRQEPCFNCNEPTEWIDVAFELRLCSDECSAKTWKEYEDDCRRDDPIDYPDATYPDSN